MNYKTFKKLLNERLDISELDLLYKKGKKEASIKEMVRHLPSEITENPELLLTVKKAFLASQSDDFIKLD